MWFTLLSEVNARLIQIAYVSDDLERATAWFEGRLGVAGFDHFGTTSLDDAIVDGAPCEWAIETVATQLGDINLEIIRPVAGAVEMYRDGIDPGAVASFHHFGYEVDNWDDAEAARESFGLAWKTRGYTPGACDFGYLDLRPVLGHYVEFMRLDPEGVDAIAALKRKYAPAQA